MNLIQRLILSAALVIVMLPQALNAQKENDKKDGVEQIVITRSGDKKEKLVVEVNGDQITINGRSAEEYKDDDITVSRKKYRELKALAIEELPHNKIRIERSVDDFSFMGNENRAMLGVVTENCEDGALVKEITEKSSAEKTGIKKGDIITKIDGEKIINANDLTEAIRKHKPGHKVEIAIIRDKKKQSLSAELGKWEGFKGKGMRDLNREQEFNFHIPQIEMEQLQRAIPHIEDNVWDVYNPGRPKLGIAVQDTEDGKGAKVIDVDKESNAEKAGILEEDLITAINDTEVNSAEEIAKIVKENKNKPSVKIKLVRAGKTQIVEVKMPRKLKTMDL